MPAAENVMKAKIEFREMSRISRREPNVVSYKSQKFLNRNQFKFRASQAFIEQWPLSSQSSLWLFSASAWCQSTPSWDRREQLWTSGWQQLSFWRRKFSAASDRSSSQLCLNFLAFRSPTFRSPTSRSPTFRSLAFQSHKSTLTPPITDHMCTSLQEDKWSHGRSQSHQVWLQLQHFHHQHQNQPSAMAASPRRSELSSSMIAMRSTRRAPRAARTPTKSTLSFHTPLEVAIIKEIAISNVSIAATSYPLSIIKLLIHE